MFNRNDALVLSGIEFVKASPSPGHEMYSVHLDTDTLRKRYMEVAE